MPTSRRREYAVDSDRHPAVRGSVLLAARAYADALALVDQAREDLLAAVERER